MKDASRNLRSIVATHNELVGLFKITKVRHKSKYSMSKLRVR